MKNDYVGQDGNIPQQQNSPSQSFHQQIPLQNMYSQNGNPALSKEYQIFQASQLSIDNYNYYPPRNVPLESQSPIYNTSSVIPPQVAQQNQQINPINPQINPQQINFNQQIIDPNSLRHINHQQVNPQQINLQQTNQQIVSEQNQSIHTDNSINSPNFVIVHGTLPPPINTTEKGQVDHSIPSIDRTFTQLTSLEQIWNLPLIHDGRPTWKFCNQQFNTGQYYHQESPIINNRESSTNQYIVTSQLYDAEPIYQQQQPQQVIEIQQFRDLPSIPSEYVVTAPVPPQKSQIPQGKTTPFVNHEIKAEERGLTGITSLEQLWGMTFFHNGNPTWKFWFALFWFLYFALIVVVILVSIMQGIGDSGSKFGGDNHCLNVVPDCKPEEFQCANIKSAARCPEIYCSKVKTDVSIIIS
ncbi:4813_t:CDS:2 [Funneliformis caledonium]|uniref:4813_t:CDS:1 n=1 Tax=Funneliformis caledonium TaxID=1117310 RepID=A0A9N8Z3R0_9GLOM|nr:4813_t:CDS:2 [Funneliformis caledonium]